MRNTLLVPFALGLLFGAGLQVSGMTSPSKVLGFLDIAGAFDPSLALVMGGAVAVGVVAFRLAKARGRALLGAPLQAPTASAIDAPLLIGGAIFGVGWGMAGICPGPAIVDLGFLDTGALVFVVAMGVGMGLERLASRISRRAADGADG
ncbi:DUF6691 family protein [Methylosinus sp. Sm6]|uniref:DUF6691 family protein n=1 Tax=Methylosinus sp. Sm6 TaxID=2866948 RepID=UPI001C99AA52|nr:DUF6691 family protein [Methylosinus sp. Sm6]MBY6242024.1 hypothetical protein [Methylosinus sp. Sm6]